MSRPPRRSSRAGAGFEDRQARQPLGVVAGRCVGRAVRTRRQARGDDYETVERAIAEAGVGFMFAPNHHPAMKNWAPVRAELGIARCSTCSVRSTIRRACGGRWSASPGSGSSRWRKC